MIVVTLNVVWSHILTHSSPHRAPSISNLRKATSEPNIKVKSRLRAKLNDRPPAFSRSATFSSAFSPRKDIPPSLRERAPSTVEDMVTGSGSSGGGGVNYSPPFKFPKLESSFFKSLPNMKNIANMEMAEKAKLVSLRTGAEWTRKYLSLIGW